METSNYKNLQIEKQKNTEDVNLIKTVKSKYILQKIFSYLEENIKLILIVHNKNYQNLFGFDINNYKNESGKYRIIEKDGICKEYTLNGNKLIFEGEFKNGKKNGKAKEFDSYNGKVLFEGIYLNGKRNGKGKKYDYINGNLIFDGTYLNGEKNGKGKEYYNDGNLEYEGEFLNGFRIEGKGYNRDGKLIFELERNGKGKEYYIDGNLKFEGDFLNGEKNGKGKYYHRNGKIKLEGEFEDGEINGNVKEYDEDGKLVFEGEYNNGKKWKGKENGKDFQGEYLNGEKWNGKAKEYKYVHLGPGCTEFGFILAFEGEYINGKKKGEGEIYDSEYQKYVLREIDEEKNIKNENKDNCVEKTINDNKKELYTFPYDIFED